MEVFINSIRASSLIAFIVSVIMLVLVIKFLIKVPKALESINNILFRECFKTIKVTKQGCRQEK